MKSLPAQGRKALLSKIYNKNIKIRKRYIKHFKSLNYYNNVQCEFCLYTHNEYLLLTFFLNYDSPDKLSSFVSKIDLASSLSLKLLNILVSYF